MADNERNTDFPHLDETVVATARYLGAISDLTDEDLRQPSLLPGWTRAHVITHLCRNADALAGLLRAAEADEVAAMYPSREERDAAIEAGAKRSAAELKADAVASSGRWVQAANELHSSHLERPGLSGPGKDPFPVRRVAMMRRTEVEVHHADLGIGYTAMEWPADFVESIFKRRHRELTEGGVALRWHATDTGSTWGTGDDGPQITGAAADLAWWLIGRGSGDQLTSSTGSLPDLGRWA